MIKRQNFKNFLAVVENSLGSTMFRNLWVMDEAKQEHFDAMENGNLSCAFYASSILKIFGKMIDYHGTVEGMEKEMLDSGVEQVSQEQLEEGDVIIWEARGNPEDNGKMHRHIGFYIGKDWAISNSSENGFPIRHHCNYNGQRKIEKVFRINWN
jgi:hypothetical protein